ncbi:MAG: SPASM domain-containing protein [Spirochaetales bacterium]|nr:SPASM domain-containing protein [Spirochaetales bacterium]
MQISLNETREQKTNNFSYEVVEEIKRSNRFFLTEAGDDLFIFDSYTTEIIRLSDNLKDLILAENKTKFEYLIRNTAKEELQENDDFICMLLDIEDNLAEDPKSKTKIHTLKLNCSTMCNMSCKYCFRDKTKKEVLQNKNLVFDAIDYIITDCGRDSDFINVNFNLTSEPLLQIDLLEEIHRYAKNRMKKADKKLEIFFITNGTIASPQLLKRLDRMLKNHTIPISIDGPPEVHDSMRVFCNQTGTYETITQNIRLYQKKKYSLSSETVLTNKYPYPLKILKHLISLGFTTCIQKTVRHGTPYSFDEKSLEELKKGYDDYFAFITESILNDDLFILKVTSKDFALRPLWRILFKQKYRTRCTWGINTISMDHNGIFYPCDSLLNNPDFAVGNVKEGIFWEKYHIDIFNDTRGQCASCWGRYICGGTCYVNGIILDNNPMTIDPIECSLTKYFIEKNLRMIYDLMQADIDIDSLVEFMRFQIYNIYLKK